MIKRALILSLFFGVVLGATSIESGQSDRGYVESVSSFICPGKNGDVSGKIAFGRRGVQTGLIDKKNRPLKKSKERALAIQSAARSVSGNAPTPIVLASQGRTWLGVTQCGSAAGEFWFVGGTADVSSMGFFQFTNENLGKAIIDIELWSEDGSESTRTLTIPPRSTKNYSLTTFMPGKKKTVFHIISRSGLVSATLFDERRKGLKSYGGDFVTPATFPAKNVRIAGIPTAKVGKKSKISSQKLRVFVPGESDAIIQVNYISPSGVFSPIGLDSLRIPAQKVVEVDLGNIPKNRLFAIDLRSSEPLVAGVLTRGKFSDVQELSWSSSGLSIGGKSGEKDEVLALPELSGYLAIVSDSSSVSFTVVGQSGKRNKVRIPLDAMANWKIPETAREIIIAAGSPAMYLSVAFQSPAGLATTPLTLALSKELTALPIFDSRLYIPRTQ